MAFMTDKFKGIYRLKAPYDLDTFQFPRDINGTYSDYDIYIDCSNGIQIYYYGHGKLNAYIPSLGRGRNIIKAIYSDFIKNIDDTNYAETVDRKDKKTGEAVKTKSFNYDGLYKDKELNEIIFNIEETDEEVLFRFSWDKMKDFEKYFKPKTSGASRSPFSSKNLPKSDYEIPEDDQLKYKEVVSKLPKENILKVGHITSDYINSLANKKNKIEDIKNDMKQKCMKNGQYIHFIGHWNDYLNYLEKEIERIRNDNG
jgi:hypothetical protein